MQSSAIESSRQRCCVMLSYLSSLSSFPTSLPLAIYALCLRSWNSFGVPRWSCPADSWCLCFCPGSLSRGDICENWARILGVYHGRSICHRRVFIPQGVCVRGVWWMRSRMWLYHMRALVCMFVHVQNETMCVCVRERGCAHAFSYLYEMQISWTLHIVVCRTLGVVDKYWRIHIDDVQNVDSEA